jgi:hypothetical protein
LRRARAAAANGVTLSDLSMERGEAHHERIGYVLVAQADGPGALAAYQAGLAIRDGLAKRDPANTQWQVDVAVSCSMLGSLDSLLLIQERQEYLSRGRNLLTTLKQAGRLHANQDWTGWFDSALRSLK